MGPSSILYLIGKVYYMSPLMPLSLILVFGYAGLKALERPSAGIGLYFASSIINPHKYAAMFYALPMAKLAFALSFLSVLMNSDKVRVRFPPQFLCLIAFILIYNISAFSAYYPEFTSKKQSEFNKVMIICFLTVWSITSRKDYDILIYSATFALLLNIGKSLTETQTKHIWYAIRGTGGWLRDSNDWALAVAMSVPLFYLVLLTAKNLKHRIFFMLSMLSALMLLPLTSSRGGFLGTAVGGVMLLLTEPRKIRSFLMTGLLLVVVIIYLPPSYSDQLNSIFDAKEAAGGAWESEHDMHGDDYTGAERVYNWKLAYEMAQDHPFFGVGVGNYVAMRAHYETHPGKTVCHSTWFQLISEAGFLGLGAFLGMIFTAIFSLLIIWWKYRKKDPWKANNARSIIAGLAAYCISATFVSREYTDLLFLYFCLAAILPTISSPPPDTAEAN